MGTWAHVTKLQSPTCDWLSPHRELERLFIFDGWKDIPNIEATMHRLKTGGYCYRLFVRPSLSPPKWFAGKSPNLVVIMTTWQEGARQVLVLAPAP